MTAILMNPEFKKQLRLELTRHRVIFPVTFVALALYLAHLINHTNGARLVALWLYLFITIIWGMRQAQATLFNEVQEGTWVSLKLSSLSPWQIVIGKLFGGLSFVWFASCLPIAIMIIQPIFIDAGNSWLIFQQGFVTAVLLIFFTPIILHALAFSFALIEIDQNPAPSKLSSLFATFIAFIFGMWWIHWISSSSTTYNIVEWFNISFQFFSIYLIALITFGAFAILSSYYLIRRSLNMPNLPFAWIIFLVWVYCFFFGFSSLIELRVSVALMMLYAFSYLNIMVEKHTLIDVKRINYSLKSCSINNILYTMPRWFISIILVFLATLLYIFVVPKEFSGFENVPFAIQLEQSKNLHNSAIALFLFFLRDIALFQFLHLFRGYRRTSLVGIFYLILLYWIIPGILSMLHTSTNILALFSPLNGISIFSALIQATTLWVLLVYKIRQHHIRNKLHTKSEPFI